VSFRNLGLLLLHLRERPPAHVRNGILAALAERLRIIDDVARARPMQGSVGRTGMGGPKFPDRRRVLRELPAHVAHTIAALSDPLVVRRVCPFGTGARLRVQGGTENQRQRSDLEQERVFPRHRGQLVHAGCRCVREAAISAACSANEPGRPEPRPALRPRDTPSAAADRPA